MTGAELTVPVDVNAPAEVVWHTVTDWPGQVEWMLGTRVEVDGPGDGRHLGARLRAFTGVGPLGFTDTMEIVEWEPPRKGAVGALGFRVIKPVFRLGIAQSLRAMARRCERG